MTEEEMREQVFCAPMRGVDTRASCAEQGRDDSAKNSRTETTKTPRNKPQTRMLHTAKMPKAAYSAAFKHQCFRTCSVEDSVGAYFLPAFLAVFLAAFFAVFFAAFFAAFFFAAMVALLL